jgi:hypothetical protein
MERYLTKSRYKLALECPTKLFYTKKDEYVDTKLNDIFLQKLAEGGFQVGELARRYFEGGINIDNLDYTTALRITSKALMAENVIIYEPAFIYNDCFIRADILIKTGKKIELIEVKSKSYDVNKDSYSGLPFYGRDGIRSKWLPYLQDIAFQKYVVEKSLPDCQINSFLMLVDKSKVASVDHLNQNFLIFKKNDRIIIQTKEGLTKKMLGEEILVKINTDSICETIYNIEDFFQKKMFSFDAKIEFLAEKYRKNERIFEDLGSKCKKCEFKATEDEIIEGKKSGYNECWQIGASFESEDFKKPHILNIWFFLKKDQFIKNKKYFKADVKRSDLEPLKPSKNIERGLSRVDRQELQIQKAVGGDTTHFIDTEGLISVFSTCKYPLHFIDFETCSVAIPFYKGMHPYEQIAFQYSHHIINENGEIEHKSQWINATPGFFPNFDFIRAFKKDLENDSGTIFRYADHENNILNKIYFQLKFSNEKDKNELCTWIKTITKSTSSSDEKWEGERNMIDLWALLKKYYYHPSTIGSNSLKDVLPAVLNESKFLQEKYSKPIYGNTIKSLNFQDHVLIDFDKWGKVINPYEKLPLVHSGINNDALDELITEDDSEIKEGGAAMIAYSKLQFTEMTQNERSRVIEALLRYCELDTLAMVMLWEAWNEWCKK